MYVLEPEIVYACKNPTVRLDDELRFHSVDQAAIKFPDGCKFYAWHGVPVAMIKQPLLFTKSLFRNSHLRSIMIEQYGRLKFLVDSNSQVIARDSLGALYRTTEPGAREPSVTVEVTNSTPKPDGFYKTYFLRVPPTVTTPREGIAWTFEMTAQQYDPTIET